MNDQADYSLFLERQCKVRSQHIKNKYMQSYPQK